MAWNVAGMGKGPQMRIDLAFVIIITSLSLTSKSSTTAIINACPRIPSPDLHTLSPTLEEGQMLTSTAIMTTSVNVLLNLLIVDTHPRLLPGLCMEMTYMKTKMLSAACTLSAGA